MIIGHRPILDFLEHSFVSNHLTGSYLFYGKKHIGKRTVARWFIKKLLQTDDLEAHPDFVCLEPEFNQKTGTSAMIGVEALRGAIGKLTLTPIMAKHLVLLIEQAETISDEGWHLLLKTLEEPRASVIIILAAETIEHIPKTALSRLLKIYFLPVPEEELTQGCLAKGLDEKIVRAYLAQSFGAPGLLLQLVQNKNQELDTERLFKFLIAQDQALALRLAECDLWSKPEFSAWFDELVIIFRDILFYQIKAADSLVHRAYLHNIKELARHYSAGRCREILKKLLAARLFLKQNVNPRLVVEDVLLAI